MNNILRIALSLLIFTFICVPAIIISIPVVGGLLLTSWDGRSTIFGNSKWGRGNNHFSHPTTGFWSEFSWLVWRNPVNNLHFNYLSVDALPYVISGDDNIGDKIAGGFYEALRLRRPRVWEYYWIKSYTLFGYKRCIRVRIGWKIHKCMYDKAAFVFAINPLKPYSGS